MNRQLYIMIYCILLGYSVSTRNIIFIISVIVFGILISALIPVYKKYRKNKIKKHVANKINETVFQSTREAACRTEFESEVLLQSRFNQTMLPQQTKNFIRI